MRDDTSIDNIVEKTLGYEGRSMCSLAWCRDKMTGKDVINMVGGYVNMQDELCAQAVREMYDKYTLIINVDNTNPDYTVIHGKGCSRYGMTEFLCAADFLWSFKELARGHYCCFPRFSRVRRV